MPFFRNLLHKLSNRHVLTDKDRETAEEIRIRKLELKKEAMEREAEIHRLKDNKIIEHLSAGDQETAALLSLFASAMNSPRPSLTQPLVNSEPVALAIKLSDEDIDKAINQLPKYALKIAKTMSPDAIKQFVTQKIGVLDEDTLNKIVNRIKL